MIGLDTNALVRYIMQDDLKQSSLATRLIESRSIESRGFVPPVSVVEFFWVM
jgi:predicted nucleic-acid-binding protein